MNGDAVGSAGILPARRDRRQDAGVTMHHPLGLIYKHYVAGRALMLWFAHDFLGRSETQGRNAR
jgi:hypothetical protein